MKKILIPLLLFAGACTNTINYDFNLIEPKLMVIGWLDQASAYQTIYISLSEGGIVKPVTDARVVCSINGKEVANVCVNRVSPNDETSQRASEATWWPSFMDSELSFHQQLPISFPALLEPGDKVQLTFYANQGSFEVSSTNLIVPEPVVISEVDTVHVTVHHLDWSDRYLQVQADVTDRKGEENWYSVSIREFSKGYYSFLDGGGDISVVVDTPRHIMDLEDPVLLDGNLSQTEDLIFFDFSGNGTFACFSDKMFKDGTAHLKMNTFSSLDDDGPDFVALASRLFMLYDHDTLVDRGFEKCRAEHWLEVYLTHCTQQTYYYLRSLRTVLSDGYYPEVVEPVTIPSNIIGGVGFVDVINTSMARINLPTKEENYID